MGVLDNPRYRRGDYAVFSDTLSDGSEVFHVWDMVKRQRVIEAIGLWSAIRIANCLKENAA